MAGPGEATNGELPPGETMDGELTPDGLVTGDETPEGLAGGELAPGEATGDVGELPRGQRLQVAAQYPPAGAPGVNMKSAPHLPNESCSNKTVFQMRAMFAMLILLIHGVLSHV